MINALIIDDEKNAINELSNLLKPFYNHIQVVDSAVSVSDALDKIETLKPDLLFLDIELKDGSGFDILNNTNANFQVVFVTGHNEYAIRAFKHSAVDYLLKPIDKKLLSETVMRVLENHSLKENSLKLELMFKSLQNKQFSKIAIPGVGGYEFINKDNIMYCESDTSYTNIKTPNRKIVTTQHLKKIDELLFEGNFFRVHKSYIVNVNFVKKVSKADGGIIIMEDEMTIPIARRRKEAFMSAMNL